jgi:hypothetical protein
VAKDEGSLYVPGARTRRWVKVKHRIPTGWPGKEKAVGVRLKGRRITGALCPQ